MPELPEVEVVRAGLERHVVGSTITRVDVLHPRPVRRDLRGPAGFAAALTGRRIESARRQSVPSRLLPVLGLALTTLLQRRFRWVGPLWAVARLLRPAPRPGQSLIPALTGAPAAVTMPPGRTAAGEKRWNAG